MKETMRQAIVTTWFFKEPNQSCIRARAYAGGTVVDWNDELNPYENHKAAALALQRKFSWDHYNDLIGGTMPDGSGDHVFVQVEKERIE
jgi:hypothetical protein